MPIAARFRLSATQATCGFGSLSWTGQGKYQQEQSDGAALQGEMACSDYPMMKIPARNEFAETDQIIHHVQWQYPQICASRSTRKVLVLQRFFAYIQGYIRSGTLVVQENGRVCGTLLEEAALRSLVWPVRSLSIQIADKLRQIAVSEQLPNRHILARVIPIVVDDALE